MSLLRRSSAVRTLFAIGVVFLAPTLGAQRAPAINDPPIRFQQLSNEDGLSQNVVRALAQDKQGFLWMATEDGLNRFDGSGFKVYQHRSGDPGSAPNGALMAMLFDPPNELWLGTLAGLSRFDLMQERFVHYRHAPDDVASLSSDSVMVLHLDASGLWVVTPVGLDHLDPESGRIDRCADLTGVSATAITTDAAGGLWIGHAGGLDRVDPQRGFKSCEITSRVALDPVWALFAAPSGSLWVGTERGLYEIPPGGGEPIRHRLDGRQPWVMAILDDQQGNLWIGSQGGLFLFGADGRKSIYTPDSADPYSLSSVKFLDLFEDHDGNIWLGTYGAGVLRFHPSDEPFRLHALDSQVIDQVGTSVRAFHQDSTGSLWIGTEGSGVLRGEPETATYSPVRLPRQPTRAFDFAVRPDDGGLWIATDKGLCRSTVGSSDGQPWRHYGSERAQTGTLSSNLVRALSFDREGFLWVGTGRGLNRLDPLTDEIRRDVPPDDPQNFSFVLDVLEDRRGSLWIASVKGLFVRDPGETRFVRHSNDPQDPASLQAIVLNIFEDSAGNLFLATQGGGLHAVYRPEGDSRSLSFTIYTVDDGLPNNVIYAILEDSRGRLWLSTNRGLSRFDPRTRRFSNYDVSDGLQNNEFNTGAAMLSGDGTMYFGGIAGFNGFRPERFQDNPRPPPVVLTSFQLFRSERRFDHAPSFLREVELAYNEGYFALEFAALNFRRSDRNHYRYLLEGFDEDWNDPGERRFASYTNVPPGSYTFRVRAANNDGVWNNDGARLRITIQSPWWKSWWAYSLYVLLTIASVGGFLWGQRLKIERERAVVRKLREVDRLKDDFLANTSHELRTPLYGMTGLAESLIDSTRGELSQAARGDLSLIVTSGRRLATLVDGLLDFSKLRHKSLELRRQPIDIRSLVDVVVTLSRPLLGRKSLVLINAVPADLPLADADENRLSQILHNLVGNAVKFTEEGEVEVTAEATDDGELVVRVRDTGIGIPESAQDRIWNAFEQADASLERTYGGTGLGLAVTRQLVELHGGRIELESSVGEGSVFSLTLPAASVPAAGVPAASVPAAAALPEDLVSLPVAEPTATSGAAEKVAGHVLVVDDEAVNLRVLSNHLRLAHFEPTTAAHGEEALALLDEENTFDLVLLDVMMPRLSGYEVCRQIRQRFSPQELPVIFLTAKSQVSDLVTGFAVGANDYLNKPIAKDELLARVRSHLDLQEIHRRMNHLIDERSRELVERERLIHELDRFNYTVSHDLLNPLTTIKNFAGRARLDARRGETEQLIEDVEHIDSAAATMVQLLDELVDYSRVGTKVSEPQAVALDEIVDAVHQRLVDDERYELVRCVDVLPVVEGDPALLLVAFEHLFGNAVKFAGDAPARITLGCRESEGGMCCVSVGDDGVGIEPAYHEKIFGLFDRLEAEGSGTGVGLALVRRIVEAHGGRVWVESEGLHRGSTFCVCLPAVGLG